MTHPKGAVYNPNLSYGFYDFQDALRMKGFSCVAEASMAYHTLFYNETNTGQKIYAVQRD